MYVRGPSLWYNAPRIEEADVWRWRYRLPEQEVPDG